MKDNLDAIVATAQRAPEARFGGPGTERGPFPWGRTTVDDWQVWLDLRKREADKRADEECRRLWQVADAYAHGFAAAIKRERGAGPARAWEDAAYAFGHEYEHAAWLYAAGRGNFRDGYARAWEMHLQAKGLA